ncbi:glycosyltransferase [Candidatus Gottesmanbacteria bacterium]|nr:glycosyltransferase [Candidatus Gottesmanbacteria bacterium]
MKISFVIPFHNEENNCIPMIERVIDFARKNKLTFEIVPVDDRSSDNTPEILKQFAQKYTNNVFPLYRRNKKGEKGNTMGKALIEGTKAATGSQVIWTMGDLADDTATYKEIIAELQSGYDMVIGSRYMLGGSRGNLDPLKAFFSSMGTRLARILFGIPVHDITNAFRGFRKEVFDSIRLDSSGFSISPEFAIKVHFSGHRLGEVPTIYTNRVRGVSNFKLYKMTLSYLGLYFVLFLQYIILRRPCDFIRKKLH